MTLHEENKQPTYTNKNGQPKDEYAGHVEKPQNTGVPPAGGIYPTHV